MKNKFVITIFFTMLFLLTSNVKAAEFTDNQTVDANKMWTIRFSGDIGFDDLTKQGISVTDSKGNKIDVSIQLEKDGNTVKVTAPKGGYIPGESYILNVGTKVHSSKGKALKNEHKLYFIIKGNELSEINTTWGEFLDLYLKENPDVGYYNPRQDISKDCKVRVVKMEYPNGLESIHGFFGYALITSVYDSKTGELLTSAGYYTDKK